MHIHSCLSPCADLAMSPRAIVARSVERGLDIIAVCDHNSAENTAAVMKAACGTSVCVLAGLEVCSSEEVHVLAVFDTGEQACELQQIVYAHLPGTNRPDLFGDQVVANEHDEVESFNERLLIGAVTIGLAKIVREIHRIGGLCIASHVNRQRYSLFSQLGFVPPDVQFDALEISGHDIAQSTTCRMPATGTAPLVRFSDAHTLDAVGRAWTGFVMEKAEVEEIRMALTGRSGRKHKVLFAL